MQPNVIDYNCSVAEVALRLSAVVVVKTIYKRHRTWQQKQPCYYATDRARARYYMAAMGISSVDLASVC